MIDKLIEFQKKRCFASNSEAAFLIKNDATFRNEINRLYEGIFHKKVTGCHNCMCDAYVKLMLTKPDTIMEKSNFKLKAGVVLYALNNKAKTMMTIHNTTDALAIKHLKAFPNRIKWFDKVPNNLEELLKPKKKTDES